MKRSRSIKLVLIGGLGAGALSGCGPGNQPQSVTTSAVYTNNFYLPGVGYYHAPFRNFYSLPYNHFAPGSGQYFFGGQWGTSPHQSITNISSPTPAVAVAAEAKRTDISRGGFGSTSHHFSTWS